MPGLKSGGLCGPRPGDRGYFRRSEALVVMELSPFPSFAVIMNDQVRPSWAPPPAPPTCGG